MWDFSECVIVIVIVTNSVGSQRSPFISFASVQNETEEKEEKTETETETEAETESEAESDSEMDFCQPIVLVSQFQMFCLPGCQVGIFSTVRHVVGNFRGGVIFWQPEHDMTSEMCPQKGVTSRGNENETLRELNRFLTGGRLSLIGQKIVQGAWVLGGSGKKMGTARQTIMMSAEFNTLGAPSPLGSRGPATDQVENAILVGTRLRYCCTFLGVPTRSTSCDQQRLARIRGRDGEARTVGKCGPHDGGGLRPNVGFQRRWQRPCARGNRGRRVPSVDLQQRFRFRGAWQRATWDEVHPRVNLEECCVVVASWKKRSQTAPGSQRRTSIQV